MDHAPARFPAARWVITLGRLYWGLLVLAAGWSVLAVVFLGRPAALVVPLLLAAQAAGWRALLAAFAAHRRGAWRLLLGLTAVSALAPTLGWLGAGSPGVGSLLRAVPAVALLALLVHRDSREWVADAAPARPTARVRHG